MLKIKLGGIDPVKLYRATLISQQDYRARFFKGRKKREIWSTKSKKPSRSQFVTDNKHCVAGRLMLFWYFKKILTKIFFLPYLLLYI